ncbi:MAG: MmgE/PrpD family protein [Phascolarctobacterium sp.]|nr:MmgE/PrpD family protein [Phascolarctobacterium sp.]
MSTKTLASFTSKITYEQLSDHSKMIAKKCILDWLGVSIRGSQEIPAKILKATILGEGDCPNGQATILAGSTQKTTTLQAAMFNGASSHTLDFDDLHNPSIIHLACVVIPGVLSLAEANHKNGKEMIAAVCAGYEAGARIGESVIPESYFFWHTTGTAGTFGAAAAAANILGLNEQETLMCYGSAGTQTAGLWEFLKEGAMSKALHVGKACYAGVLSALLAKNGFTGASQICEGEKGFCRAMVANPHLEKLTENLDINDLKIDHNSFKPYACCKHSHASNYAVQTICKENSIKISDIKGIKLFVNNVTNFLINNPNPQNPYGCKFSIQYCVSACAKHGVVGIEQFSPEAINDPEVRALMSNVEVIQDPEEEAIFQADASKLASKVTIILKNGKEYTMQVDYPKGDPDNTLTWQETEEKFMHLATPVYGELKARKLCTLIKNLETCTDFAKDLAMCLEN